jgi:hypothetical protein
MKKVVCFITAMMLCVSLIGFAFAADVEFVPSISYKGAPNIVEITDNQGNPAIGTIVNANGENIGYLGTDCLLITPLSEANTSTKIPAAAKETLLSVYEQLENGSMKLPYGAGVDGDKMIVRDLFDVSWLCTEHPALIAPKGVTVTLTFNIGIKADVTPVVMTYINGVWEEIVSVKNNGNGTITCVFEDFCPVAISVPVPGQGPDDTSDKSNVMLWTILLAVSATAVVVMLVMRRRDFMK